MTALDHTNEIVVLKQLYAAINRDDIAAAVLLFHPEIVRVEPEGFPLSGTYRGLEEMKSHFLKGRTTWAEGGCHPERFAVIGDKVVAFIHVRVRLKDKIEWIDAHTADVFRFKEGKVTEMRSYAKSEDALTWAENN